MDTPVLAGKQKLTYISFLRTTDAVKRTPARSDEPKERVESERENESECEREREGGLHDISMT